MTIENLNENIKAYALKNAIAYEGKTNSGAVLSGLFNEMQKVLTPRDFLSGSFKTNTIQEAKELLILPQNSHQKILGVAFEVGFGNKASFNHTFKKYTGQTPSQYQKEHFSKTNSHKK